MLARGAITTARMLSLRNGKTRYMYMYVHAHAYTSRKDGKDEGTCGHVNMSSPGSAG